MVDITLKNVFRNGYFEAKGLSPNINNCINTKKLIFFQKTLQLTGHLANKNKIYSNNQKFLKHSYIPKMMAVWMRDLWSGTWIKRSQVQEHESTWYISSNSYSLIILTKIERCWELCYFSQRAKMDTLLPHIGHSKKDENKAATKLKEVPHAKKKHAKTSQNWYTQNKVGPSPPFSNDLDTLVSDAISLNILNFLFRPHLWGEELYTQMRFFCSDIFGRSIYSS